MFQAGYEAIDFLDGSVAGQDESTAHLASLLDRAPERVKTAPTRELRSRKKEDAKQVKPRQEATSKPSDAIFARPRSLEELSGKRHVPVLYSAQQIPVLRLSKPQPQVLSQYIDKRIKTRQKRLDRMRAMERGAELGQLEDAWDEELLQQHSVRLGRNGNGEGFGYEPSWSEEFEVAQDEVGDALSRETDRHKVMAEKMQGVVDREQELFDQERRERKERLRLEKIERRRQRRVGKDEGDAGEAAAWALG